MFNLVWFILKFAYGDKFSLLLNLHLWIELWITGYYTIAYFALVDIGK